MNNARTVKAQEKSSATKEPDFQLDWCVLSFALAGIACAGRNEMLANRKPCLSVRMLHPEMTRPKETNMYDGSKIDKGIFKAWKFRDTRALRPIGCSVRWHVCITERFGGKCISMAEELFFKSELLDTAILWYYKNKSEEKHRVFDILFMYMIQTALLKCNFMWTFQNSDFMRSKERSLRGLHSGIFRF